jgi:hypothetical protein
LLPFLLSFFQLKRANSEVFKNDGISIDASQSLKYFSGISSPHFQIEKAKDIAEFFVCWRN